MAKGTNILVLLAVTIALSSMAYAGAPLPLHNIEGNSGVYLTTTAYLVNPPAEGEVLGLPSFSISTVFIDQKDLQAYCLTENILGRIEVGFGAQRLGLGDWSDDVFQATTITPDNSVQVYNLNTRIMAVKEGDFDCPFMPAVTFGGHFKWNDGITNIDRQLGGLVSGLGADHDFGTDLTVVASKTIAKIHPKVCPRPVIISAGLRNSDAIHTGFVGFAGERKTTFEGNIIVLLTDNLAFATEYRQKPSLLRQSGSLVRKENDWWSVALAYVVNNNMSITGGYTNLGNLLNHREDNAWLFQFKYEF